MRIVALLLDDGRIEFGLEQRQTDGSWSPPQLPSTRFFPTGAAVGRWLRSSPLSLTTDLTVRIAARRLDDGRVEFGLQHRLSDDSWSAPQLPSSRFFPTSARVGRWLRSSPISVTRGASGVSGDDGGGSNAGFVAVTAGDAHSCGLRANGSVVCWGFNRYGQRNAPRGTFTAVAAGWRHTCGVRQNATITCWGSNEWRQSRAPRGAFVAVSAGKGHSCGLRTNGTVVCWGANNLGQRDVPTGAFTAITSGELHSCGLRTSGAVACWGYNEHGQLDAPGGAFAVVEADWRHTCGLRRDGTLACWGNSDWQRTIIPRGSFSTVSAGVGHTCLLRHDATVTCRGYNYDGQAISPRGAFTAISAGSYHSCGLRRNATITCWGRVLGTRLPAGVNVDRGFDPSSCRPRGYSDDAASRYGVTAGFPLPANAVAATGTMRVAVLFVDFPDAPSERTTHEEAELSLPDAERYIETASYGKLDVEFVPLYRWLRATHNHAHYLENEGRGIKMGDKIVEEAVRQADRRFDFGGFDSVVVILPSTHFRGSGWHGDRVLETDETALPDRVLINTRPSEQARDHSPNRSKIIAHELVHTLGLADYYLTGGSRIDPLPTPPSGKLWVTSDFGLMHLESFFLADETDPRLAYVVEFPSGGRSATRYRNRLNAREMLAWSRWQLGWLDDSQVRCITDALATITLTPAAAPGNGTAMAAVPLSDTDVIVIESKRSIGYDAREPYRWASGSRTSFPGLAAEGVLVYTVDADRATGELPLRIAGTDSGGRVDDYPILAVGQSITVRGYTITVDSATDTTHTVSVTKTAAN